VEHAMQALNDLGEVARLAKAGTAALQDVRITLFHPVRMMLAQARGGKPVEVEWLPLPGLGLPEY
jgi:ATP-dependent DNA ligase